MLVVVTPAWLVAADASAMLYGKGVVLRNGVAIPNSSAMFSGDLIETRADSIGTLNSVGSSVVILPISLVQFQGSSVSLEHGAVTVATSHRVSVRVGCMTIVPLSDAWTQYGVMDVNGSIKITAEKNDIRLDMLAQGKAPKEVSTGQAGSLREGEETTRYESDGCKAVKNKKETGAVPTASGGVLSSDYVKWLAIAGLGTAGAFVSAQPDDPVSPFTP